MVKTNKWGIPQNSIIPPDPEDIFYNGLKYRLVKKIVKWRYERVETLHRKIVRLCDRLFGIYVPFKSVRFGLGSKYDPYKDLVSFGWNDFFFPTSLFLREVDTAALIEEESHRRYGECSPDVYKYDYYRNGELGKKIIELNQGVVRNAQMRILPQLGYFKVVREFEKRIIRHQKNNGVFNSWSATKFLMGKNDEEFREFIRMGIQDALEIVESSG